MPAGRSHTPKSIVTTNDAVVLIQSAGQHSFACVNRSRTREAPTPTIASTNSDAAIEKNGTSASPVLEDALVEF